MPEFLKIRETDRNPGEGPSSRGWKSVSGINGMPFPQKRPLTEEERKAEAAQIEADRIAGEKAEKKHRASLAAQKKAAAREARESEEASKGNKDEMAELRQMIGGLAQTVQTLAASVKELKNGQAAE